MAAKTTNLIKYLIKGKESRKKTLQKEMRTVDAQIAKLKGEMKNAMKREAAAAKAKKVKKVKKVKKKK
ncbi:MAG: hypothetical protein JXA07_13785 [Spirochaetes bacterium]|nr:hypothetical protein [Spirochaetota bacterium]